MKVRAVLAGALAAVTMVGTAFAPSASALPVIGDTLDEIADVVLCNAAGNVYVTPGTEGRINIAVQGFGRCQGGDDRGPYTARFSGQGSALPLNGCQGFPPLVTGLRIPVDMTLRSTSNPRFTQTVKMTWQLAISTFPRIAEHLIYERDPNRNLPTGAGIIRTTAQVCSGEQRDSGAVFDFGFVDRGPIIGQ